MTKPQFLLQSQGHSARN